MARDVISGAVVGARCARRTVIRTADKSRTTNQGKRDERRPERRDVMHVFLAGGLLPPLYTVYWGPSQQHHDDKELTVRLCTILCTPALGHRSG